jgi:hypothetical protein
MQTSKQETVEAPNGDTQDRVDIEKDPKATIIHDGTLTE